MQCPGYESYTCHPASFWVASAQLQTTVKSRSQD